MEYLIEHSYMPLENPMNMVWVLFIGGLLGSFMHCAGMCGPFVIAQTSKPSTKDANKQDKSTLRRMAGLSLLPYHAGRMLTYCCLGVLVASISNTVMTDANHKTVAAILLVFAGLLFIWTAFPFGKKYKRTSNGSNHFAAFIGRLSAPFLQGKSVYHTFILGILLGFLPCGFLYAALMAVSASGNILIAAAGMAAFVIGTMPSLVLIGISGRFAHQFWPKSMQFTTRIFMTLNGISLVGIGGRILL